MDPIGRFFTPLEWAKFAVGRSGMLPKWLAGQTVLDPTAGEGHLLMAFVELALDEGHSLAELPLETLYGIEIDPLSHTRALENFRTRYGVDISDQYCCADLFDLPPWRCDLVLGNPPWTTFCDLPPGAKALYQPRFSVSGLTPDLKRLLLGASRVDVAALVAQKVLGEYLAPGGEAWFFLPLSLFLNDGAHEPFRHYRIGEVSFAPRVIYDFQSEKIFGSVATRYGLVGFVRDVEPRFPIPYYQKDVHGWTTLEARPAFAPSDPLSISVPGAVSPWDNSPKIRLARRSTPRQGVNTGGANAVFFFDRCEAGGDGMVAVGRGVLLPGRYIHPLLTSAQFRGAAAPTRWVLIPHDDHGRPLTPQAIEAEPLLAVYLARHEAALLSRRGVLVGARRSRGLWWALQGVGPYSFAPYKIVWEAYGRSRFEPRLFHGHWQVNQSLQAYVPCWDEDEAQRVLEELGQPWVAQYLASLQMENTMNWAQPGRIRRLVEFLDQ